MKKKTAVFDLDGVVIDCYGALENYIRSEKDCPDFSMTRCLTYNFNGTLKEDLVPDWLRDSTLSNPNFSHYLNANRDEIFKSFGFPDLYASMKPYDKVVEDIKDLSQYCNIVFYGFAYSEGVTQVKLRQLHDLFRDIECEKRIHTVQAGVFKKPPVGADYFCEDCVQNLGNCIGTETKLLLVDSYYNQEVYNPELSSVFKSLQRHQNCVKAIEFIKSDCQN